MIISLNRTYTQETMIELETFNEKRHNEKLIRIEEREEVQQYAQEHGKFEQDNY